MTNHYLCEVQGLTHDEPASRYRKGRGSTAFSGFFGAFAAATLLLSLALAPLAFAQETVSGIVVDAADGATLPGVNVFAEGTTLGTTTGADGRFELVSATTLTSLTFSHVGYRALTIQLGSEDSRLTTLTVSLVPVLVDLQPVVVSAGRGAQARTDAPVAIDALSAQQLEETKPTMLFQALNQVPGVHMANLGNEQHVMSIRQPLQYKALYIYLEDGLPIRPTGIFNHNALIEVNMAAIERVEVIRGPASALYGSNAIGGAVNFITAKPPQVLQGSLNARSDNYGYRRGDFNIGTTRGKLGLFFGGYAARQRDSWAEHTDFDKVSLSLRADYEIGDRTDLVTTVSTNHLDADMRGSLDSLNFYGRGYSTLQTFTYRKVDATRIRSTLMHNWSGSNSSQLTLGYRRNAVGQVPAYRVRNDLADPLRATGEINENSFDSYLADFQHRIYFGAREAMLIAGLSADLSPTSFYARFLEIERSATGQYVSYADMDSSLTDYDVDLLGLGSYAQFEFVPMNRLRVVASLRYDRIEYRYDNHLSPSSFSGAPDGTDGFNRISPKLGFTYDFGKGRGIYANYSQGFVPPEVGELYRGVRVPSLESATFDSYEFGGWAALVSGKLYVNGSVYRMDGRNEIVSVRLDDGSTENRNAGRTLHAGVEYALVYTPVRALTLRLGGTNARHKYVEYQDAGVVFDGNRMDLAPGWIANAEAAYRPPVLPGARIALEWQHLGDYNMDAANTRTYDGYDLLNLRVGYEHKGVEVWANVENLADRLYANTAEKNRFGYNFSPGAARNVVFGLGYNFGRGN